MTDASPRLDLPMILPAQAQKHVTHNEALLRLDGAVQMVLHSLSQSEPPAAPVEGLSYFTSDAATGAWAEYPRLVATYTASGWIYLQPAEGWLAWDASAGKSVVYRNDAWQPVPLDLKDLPAVGINATADTTNRLIVSAQATLLTHEGNSHQLKVNKASQSDTASVVLQTNWSGRAELGLCGDDALHFKVSADGGTWHEAVVIDPATGHLSGTAVQSSADDVTVGRLMRADYGYCPGNVVGEVQMEDGTPTGAVIETSQNILGTVTKFADGTQICVCTLEITGATSGMGALYASGTELWDYPAPFVGAPTLSVAISGQAGAWGALTGSTPTETSAEVQILSALSTNEVMQVHCTAIGRWA